MKVLLLCLKAFETLEFSPFIDVMGWARDDYNCDISVDICGFNQEIKSTFGVSISADILIDEVDVDKYDALAIPVALKHMGFMRKHIIKKH